MKKEDAIRELANANERAVKNSDKHKLKYCGWSVVLGLLTFVGLKRMGDHAYSSGRLDATADFSDALKKDYEQGNIVDPKWEKND